MRGSPLLRALLAFVALLALGWPLRRLTTTADAPREQQQFGMDLAALGSRRQHDSVD